MLALHRGGLLQLADVVEQLQDGVHDAATFVDVGELATAKQNFDQHLVFLVEELARPLDFDFDVMPAGLGTDADFLDVNLVLLLLVRLLFLLILELAIVHDLADGRPFAGGDLHEIQPRLPGQLHRLARRHDAKHGPFVVDHPNGRDPNLLVDPHIPLRSVAVGVAIDSDSVLLQGRGLEMVAPQFSVTRSAADGLA